MTCRVIALSVVITLCHVCVCVCVRVCQLTDASISHLSTRLTSLENLDVRGCKQVASVALTFTSHVNHTRVNMMRRQRVQAQVFIDTLVAPRLNNLIKQEKV